MYTEIPIKRICYSIIKHESHSKINHTFADGYEQNIQSEIEQKTYLNYEIQQRITDQYG